MFCDKCGANIDDGSVFCEHCGAPVEGGESYGTPVTSVFSQVPPTQPNQPIQPGMPVYPGAPGTMAQPPKKGKKWPIFVAIGVIIVLVIVIIVALSQGEAESGSSSKARSDKSSSSSTSYPAPRFDTVETSSVLAPDKNTSDYTGRTVLDGIPETAWNEGAAGDGSGQWIQLNATSKQHVTSVSIMGGYPKLYYDGSDVYYKNNRPRQITISYEGGSQNFQMDDLRGQFQTFTFTNPVDTTYIRITIDSVYKGNNYNDCCIAEVKVS